MSDIPQSAKKNPSKRNTRPKSVKTVTKTTSKSVKTVTNYRDWSFGFGNVNISHLNIIIFNQTVSPTIIPTNELTKLPIISTTIQTIISTGLSI